ncbi:MAG: hypothetical protein H0V44_17520 [Planctomycetes bacterium]|nr:hypothetical protein [Planctomycetota bacterium]
MPGDPPLMLVADAHPEDARLLREAFAASDPGIRIESALSGADAIRRIESNRSHRSPSRSQEPNCDQIN